MSINNGAYNNKGASTGTPGGKYSQGDTSSKSNLQPYITCYMWKRTAWFTCFIQINLKHHALFCTVYLK